MQDKNLQKEIDRWKNVKMSHEEKSRILDRVLGRTQPQKSTYVYVSHFYTRAVLTFAVFLVFFAGVSRASNTALPGDVLYPLKTNVVEPMLGVVHTSPADKIEWEEEKIIRRIAEAEQLVEKNELDDEKLAELEEKIEKNAISFSNTIHAEASSSADKIKSDFRKKIEVDDDDDHEEEGEVEFEATATFMLMESAPEDDSDNVSRKDSSENSKKRDERIKRLKERAVKTLERKRDKDDDF